MHNNKFFFLPGLRCPADWIMNTRKGKGEYLMFCFMLLSLWNWDSSVSIVTRLQTE
jgi:hypothetical protein